MSRPAAVRRRSRRARAAARPPAALSLALSPLTALFPSMAAEQYAALKESIARHGLLEPLLVHRGEVIDGRHRWRACQELGLEPRVQVLPEDADPLACVLARNAARRDLSPSQRALIAARLSLRSPRGRPAAQASAGPLTVDQAAAQLAVGARSVKRARGLLQGARPDLVAAVEAGRLSVHDAHGRLARPPTTGAPAAAQQRTVRAAPRNRPATEAPRAPARVFTAHMSFRVAGHAREAEVRARLQAALAALPDWTLETLRLRPESGTPHLRPSPPADPPVGRTVHASSRAAAGANCAPEPAPGRTCA